MLRCDYGNGLTDQRHYDLQGRLQTQQLSNAAHTIIDQRHYRYDKNSNILNITSNHENNHYQYDKLDRITQDQINTDNPNQLSYDLNDNRLNKNKQNQSQTENYRYQPTGTTTTTTTTKSNRLLEIETLKTGTTPIPASADRKLNYNDAGRLYQLLEDGLLKAEYIYNDQGQRTRKTVYNTDGITVKQITVYHYDQAGQLITETTETGQLIKDYIWFESQHPIAQISQQNQNNTENLIYLYTDHLNTNRLATDQNQNIVWRWEGEAFGSTQPEELAGLSVNLRFPGQYFDSETSLHYNWMRYYDPEVGRYITSDPIGLLGGLNTYGYVGGNPLSFTDPTGLLFGLFDGSSGSCYAVGMRIVCVSGQRPPPPNGKLMPDSTLTCKTKCNIVFLAICGASGSGVTKLLINPERVAACTVAKYLECLKCDEDDPEPKSCPITTKKE